MLTPSAILLVIGSVMLPGGVLARAPAAVSISVIMAGSVMVVLGATLGVGSITWTEIKFGPLKGIIDARDREFRQFYRANRERLLRFTTLMSGDPPAAEALLLDASKQTRLEWAAGASDDPVKATLRTLLHWLESPNLWHLFRSRTPRRRRRGSWARVDRDPVDPAITSTLAELPFSRRAALLLDGLLGVGVPEIALLLGRTEDQVRDDVEAAMREVKGRPAADAYQ